MRAEVEMKVVEEERGEIVYTKVAAGKREKEVDIAVGGCDFVRIVTRESELLFCSEYSEQQKLG